VFAGLITALAARGAGPLSAALWAAQVHGQAGQHAAERAGGEGILARDLPREIPAVLTSLTCS
jgi:NAD(P)H-hydrate repair Nnr-like enzyme with NAD(P)H-hydrate dehydratase domain